MFIDAFAWILSWQISELKKKEENSFFSVTVQTRATMSNIPNLLGCYCGSVVHSDDWTMTPWDKDNLVFESCVLVSLMDRLHFVLNGCECGNDDTYG